jgi:hypothetical protein
VATVEGVRLRRVAVPDEPGLAIPLVLAAMDADATKAGGAPANDRTATK